MLGKFSVALLAAMVLSQGENAGSSVPSQEHVKQVILSLPPDSEMRRGHSDRLAAWAAFTLIGQ
jgi:hypothetical protein